MPLLDPTTWQSRPLRGDEYTVTEPATREGLGTLTLAVAEDIAPFGGTAASGTGARFGGEADPDAFTDLRWTTVRGDVAGYPF